MHESTSLLYPVITLYLLITVSCFKFGDCCTNEMDTASGRRRCTRVNDCRVRCSLWSCCKNKPYCSQHIDFCCCRCIKRLWGASTKIKQNKIWNQRKDSSVFLRDVSSLWTRTHILCMVHNLSSTVPWLCVCRTHSKRFLGMWFSACTWLLVFAKETEQVHIRKVFFFFIVFNQHTHFCEPPAMLVFSKSQVYIYKKNHKKTKTGSCGKTKVLSQNWRDANGSFEGPTRPGFSSLFNVFCIHNHEPAYLPRYPSYTLSFFCPLGLACTSHLQRLTSRQKPQHRFQMDKWEFHSSSHIVFIDSDSLKAQSERLGEETETEVSDTVLEVLSVTVTLCAVVQCFFWYWYINV